MAGTGLGSKARPRPCRAVGQFVDQSRLVAAAAEQETQYRLPGAGEGQFPGVVCTWRQGNRSCATKQASRASAQDHCGSQTLRGGDSDADHQVVLGPLAAAGELVVVADDDLVLGESGAKGGEVAVFGRRGQDIDLEEAGLFQD